MKKITFALLLACLWLVDLSAQDNDDKNAAFQLSFVPPLSTQGLQAPKYTNAISVNMLAGVSKNVTKFSLSGIGMYVLNDISGVHFSGVGTIAGNNGSGVLASGVLNRTNDFQGFQMSGVLNLANEVEGFQIAGMGNVSVGDLDGFQIGGVVNTARVMNGFQVSGAINQAKQTNGFQVGGLVNVADELNGFQVASLANKAENVNGSQIAGLVNVAKSVSGFQIGVLANISDDCDYPIGLVNIVRNGGEMSLGLTYDAIGTTMLSFRSGGRILYGIVGIGFNHELHSKKFMTEGGFGAHIPITSRFRINNELKSNLNIAKKSIQHQSFAIMPAFKVCPGWEVFAGPSINYLMTENTNERGVFPGHSIWKKFRDDKLKQVYIGFSVGTHIIF